jgi:hypothetical protein
MTNLGAMILNLDLNKTTVIENNTTNTKEINITKVNAIEVNLTKKLSTVLIEHNSSN